VAGACARAAAAAAPQTAAAEAPPLITLRTAQGSGLYAGVLAVAATAAVELKNIDPAINTPIAPRRRETAICLLPWRCGNLPPQENRERLLQSEVSFHRHGRKI
jgi:hypothetical protein